MLVVLLRGVEMFCEKKDVKNILPIYEKVNRK